MNFAAIAIRNRVTTLVLTFVAIGTGLIAFDNLSWLEDPEFTIKEALVITPYPGASAAEVELEVTDRIEQAVQQLGQLRRIKRSKSERGLSTVTVQVKDKYDKALLPQVWDELRRKVHDAQGQLPPGAGPSVVYDDFGDVWGVFVILYGDDFSYAELKETAKFLRREFTLERDVAKVQLFGDLSETIYIEPNRERMSQQGISPDQITRKLSDKNIVTDSGRIEFGENLVHVEPTGMIGTIEEFGSILISAEDSERLVYLRDVAEIRRGYKEPATAIARYDGKRGIGIGISTTSGGNAVKMGEALSRRFDELESVIPAGMSIGIVSLQSEATVTAIQGFLVSLIEAVVIVVVVLMIFMGLRSAMIIGFILFLTICGTFVFMGPWGVALERISLGALIIALGMLVDNAIVIVDGILMKLQEGKTAEQGAEEVVQQQAMPLLGATAVAIIAFAAIGVSQDSTGEYCRSLFQVVFLSLGLSWVTAVTVTPLLGVMFLKAPDRGRGESATESPYDGGFYKLFKKVLAGCIRMKWVTIGVVVALFAMAVYGFGYLETAFFPASTRPQIMVEYWLPMGTRIERTEKDVVRAEEYLRGLPNVGHVTAFVGQGGMRFLLTYTGEQPDSGYAQFLVDVDDYEVIDGLIDQLQAEMPAMFPEAIVYGKKFSLGPGEGGKVQVRVTGDDHEELRRLGQRVQDIFHADGGAKGIRSDWREKQLMIEPRFAPEQASITGIDLPDLAATIRQSFEGLQTGVFRERDELIPIVVRDPGASREEISNIRNLQIWSPTAYAYIPIRQIAIDFETRYEDGIVMRRNRKPTVTVHADPVSGTSDSLLARVRPKLEALDLPPGFFIGYGGEYESSSEGQQALANSIPTFVILMVLIVIMLFNSLRQPLIIFAMVPLALIGVSAGLLATRQPFGFMALLGFLSLSGMLIKNAIVLIDQIDLEIREDKEPGQAILDASASRLRPVSMAALTTILGMIPLLGDAFFIAMAVTIMAGLSFATFLTMLVIPVLYATFFRIRV